MFTTTEEITHKNCLQQKRPSVTHFAEYSILFCLSDSFKCIQRCINWNLYRVDTFLSLHDIYTASPMSYLYFYSKDHEIKTLLRASNEEVMLSEKIVCSVYFVCSCCNELYTCETSVWSVFVHANAFMRVSVTCLLMRGSVRLTSQCLMEWLITSDFHSNGCSVNSDIFSKAKKQSSEVTGNNVRVSPCRIVWRRLVNWHSSDSPSIRLHQ